MSQQSILQLVRGQNGFRPGDCCYRYSASTGVIAAGLAANGVVFGMLAGQPGNGLHGYIERIRLQYTCITAFGTPITAGRALAISGPTAGGLSFSGGTNVIPFEKGNSPNGASVFTAAAGGQCMIATTGALTGPVPDGIRLATLSLAGAGNAGDVVDKTFDFTGDDTAPIAIDAFAGLRLMVYAPQLMDATGTFQLVVEVDTNELPVNYVNF